jgi:hypothetical protein
LGVRISPSALETCVREAAGREASTEVAGGDTIRSTGVGSSEGGSPTHESGRWWPAGIAAKSGKERGVRMAEFTTSDGTQIFYRDWGAGQPIVFSHGWPLSADDWDAQMLFFLQHGYG